MANVLNSQVLILGTGIAGLTSALKFADGLKALLAAGVVSFCLFLSLIVQSRVTQSKLSKTDGLLERSVRSFFGPMSPSALKTYMTSTSTLRNSINRELTKQRELSKLFGPSLRSPLEVLIETALSAAAADPNAVSARTAATAMKSLRIRCSSL